VFRTRVLPIAAAILVGLSGSVPLAAASTSIQPSPQQAAPATPSIAQGTSAATPARAAEPVALTTDKKKPAKGSKADSAVASVIDADATSGPAAAAAHATSVGLKVQKGKVQVILETSNAAVAALGAKGKGTDVKGTAGNLVEVMAAPGQLKSLLDVAGVTFVRSPMPHTAEAVTDEGVAATNASTWQSRGQNGAGVKVAVIDLGFTGLAAAQSSGDLPSVTSVDDCGGGFNTVTNHGTAVAEIVHKMAPAAQLYLICIDTEVDLANAEAYAKANGISIINHSVGWFNTSRGDGSGDPGTPDATVADAAANGILWVNAAGNNAQEHWSGTFVNSGLAIDDGFNSPLNSFGTGPDIGNNFTVGANAVECAFLKWDSWPTTAEDYDLYVVRASDNLIVAASYDTQDGTQPPTEATCFQNTGATQSFYVAISRFSAAGASRLDLFLSGSAFQYQTAAGSVVEPASSTSAFAVGAACWRGTAIEPFSSRGPTIGGAIKPDLTGPDGVSTKTYGVTGSSCTTGGGFYGTSAATPHVTGAAALVKGAYPSFTASDIKTYLAAQAQDLGTAGKDNVFGSGLLHLPTVEFTPSAPTGVQGVGHNQAVDVTWTAPSNPGSSPITGYTVTSAPDGKTCTTTGALACTVGTLTNGTPYTFTVTATNSAGTGPASAASAPVTPNPGPPLAPTGVTATRGDTSALVSWTAPDANGSPITGYTVTASDGVHTCTTTVALSCTVNNLTNGTAYTFTVTATSLLGTGPASAASNSVTPAGLPTAPTGVVAAGYHQSALVTWTASDANGSPITGYTVTSAPGALTCTTAGATSCTVNGLTNGLPYTFTVTATNAVGTGPASAASAPATPQPVPAAPTGVAAIGLDTKVTVGWTAPADNGTGAITSYTVTSSPGGITCTWTTGPLTCDVTGLTNRTPYTFTVTATNASGTGPSSAPVAATPLSGATYHPVDPARLLDTRSGNGLSGAFTPRAPRAFQVTTRGGVPAGAVAVTGNLTVTGQTSAGFLSLGPASVADPTTSTLNFPLGDTRANGVTVKLSADGKLWVTAALAAGKTAQVLFDVTGYFTSDASGATYHPVDPARLLDTRSGNGLTGAFTPSAPRAFVVWGRGNVPSGATAVTGNLTVTGQTTAGFLSLGPTSVVSPTTSTLNFPLGDTRANGVTVKLSADGKLWVTFIGTAGKTAQVLFDVTGYFTNDASGATYTAVDPQRLLDTRSGNGLTGPFTPSVPRSFQVTTRGVPSGASAVTGNLTVTGQTSAGFLSLGPASVASPTTSTLNFPMGDTRANGVTVKLSLDGKLWVTFIGPAGKTAQVLFDVTGYFTN
jgi:hypothetical protein